MEKALIDQFIDLHYHQKKSKKIVMEILHITNCQYRHLLPLAKKHKITEINTEALESLLLPKLNNNPDNETIKMALEIWKYKYKVGEPPNTLLDGDVA